MMGIMQIYAIFDMATGTTGFLFESANDKTAIRSCKPQIKENKEDFKLLRIGTIDHNTQKIDPISPIVVYVFGDKEEVE